MLRSVAVVGAGISGLTAGYALKKIGLEVDVFERSDSVIEFGAGITLSRNATSLLDDLGLLETLSERGCFPMGSYIRDYKNANIINAMSFDESFIALDRRDLVEQLVEKLNEEGVEISFGTNIQSISPSTGEIKFTNESAQGYDLILLCDGINSSFRKEHFDNCEPQFTNYVAWRGMVSSDKLPQFEGSEKVNVYHGPGGHCVHYPTGREGLINFVAIEYNPYWAEESWKVEGSKSDFLECFKGWNEELLSMLNSTEVLYKWGIFERPLPGTLYKDKCVLLGDAAHPMVPFLGQGACMAIEDAYSFAMACKENIANLSDAQQAYDYVRSKRTKKIQRLSMMQGKIYHMKNPLLVAARNAVMKYTNIPGNDLKRIHDYDAHDEMQIYLAFGDLRHNYF